MAATFGPRHWNFVFGFCSRWRRRSHWFLKNRRNWKDRLVQAELWQGNGFSFLKFQKLNSHEFTAFMIVLMLYTIVSLITCIWTMRGSILVNYFWFFQVMLHIVFPGRCCIVSTCFLENHNMLPAICQETGCYANLKKCLRSTVKALLLLVPGMLEKQDLICAMHHIFIYMWVIFWGKMLANVLRTNHLSSVYLRPLQG